MIEPRTKAGRTLTEEIADCHGSGETYAALILAIEAEAADGAHRWCVPHDHVEPDPVKWQAAQDAALSEAALLARPQSPEPATSQRHTSDSQHWDDAVDYAELERLARAATPGPWFQQSILVHGPDQGGFDIGPVLGWHDFSEADARLIVAMRNALPALLARRAPGDRDAKRIAELSAARDKWRARAADCMEARARLRADSRPEQPAPLDARDWQDAWNEWRAEPGGHPAVSAFEAGWNAALAVRPEEPPRL